MGNGDKQTAPRKRGAHGALSNRRAAISFAKVLAPYIRELHAEGFATQNAIARELRRRKVPTARGGKWHPTTVERLMARLGTFNIPKSKGVPKAIKTADAIDVAARYFVYKLYEATAGQQLQWHVLHGMGEKAATISRAVERGWVVLRDDSGSPLKRSGALTDEGRRLGRWGRRA
jgi:hypothetical protein